MTRLLCLGPSGLTPVSGIPPWIRGEQVHLRVQTCSPELGQHLPALNAVSMWHPSKRSQAQGQLSGLLESGWGEVEVEFFPARLPKARRGGSG